LVVLAIVGLSAGVVGLSMMTLAPQPAAEVPRRLAEARRLAIRSDGAVTVELAGGTRVTFRADGSATPARIQDSTGSWLVDPWTGQVRRE
jgi:hypothetical protein